MRILYICADHGIPILGRRGCSTHVRETCRALQSEGHEVTILCSQKGDDLSLGEGLRIIEVSPGKSRQLGYDGRNIWHNLALYRVGKQIVETEKMQAIYERFSLYSFVGTRLGKRYHLPRVLEINAFLSVEHRHKLHFLRMAERAEGYIARQAPALVVVSQPLHDSLVELGVASDRISNMPMAVDIDHFRPDPARREEARLRWDLDQKFVIGYVGSLSGWHGISLLPTMACQLLKTRSDFAIFVVGGEERHLLKYRDRVEQMGLSDHLRFVGSVPYEEVPSCINAMDVALVPDTNYWTCPTKMFEYQASGVPTIAPRYPAIEKAMDHLGEGMIFEPRNIEQAVQHILHLADRPELREEMGHKSRERVSATHSWQRNVERVVRLFHDMQTGRISLDTRVHKAQPV
ncbi:glycosyltransferase family 4 protein [bacterium]|nr:glycosyltransferase family 4 protein [bacterium]